MAAITAVHALAAVALMLGVSEELLHDLLIEMEPECGLNEPAPREARRGW